MGYYRQFEILNPLTGQVPGHPIAQLPAIARRARLLLDGRTNEQVIAAASNIDWFIERHFESEEDDYVHSTLSRDGWELSLLPESRRNDDGLRHLIRNWPSDADGRRPNFATRENTRDLEALKSCISWYSIEDAVEFPNGTESEHFAVLALWKVGDAIDRLNQTTELKLGVPEIDKLIEALPPEYSVKNPAYRLSIATEYAMEALESVCWAEHLKAISAKDAELKRLQGERRLAPQEVQALADTMAKQKISVASQKAAIQRHRVNHEKKEAVFAWCEQHFHTFPSIEQAADAIVSGSDKVADVAFRTARDWVSEWKRGQGAAPKP